MDNKDKSIYAYFIDTHDKSKTLNISLSPEYKEGDAINEAVKTAAVKPSLYGFKKRLIFLINTP